MRQFKRILLMVVSVIMVGFAASLTLKAAIGVGAWDALAQTISLASGIKVGTIGMILNCLCVLGQLLLLRKDFKLKYLLQVPVSILVGVVINFFYYDVFSLFTIESYFANVLMLLAAFVISALAIGSIMILDVVTFALEGFCMAISRKTGMKFPIVRQVADVSTILISILITVALALPFSIREGTIIGMLVFAPLMGFFMNKIRPIYRKLDLVPVEEKTSPKVAAV